MTVIYTGTRNQAEIVSEKYGLDLANERKVMKELLEGKERHVEKVNDERKEDTFQIHVQTRFQKTCNPTHLF